MSSRACVIARSFLGLVGGGGGGGSRYDISCPGFELPEIVREWQVFPGAWVPQGVCVFDASERRGVAMPGGSPRYVCMRARLSCHSHLTTL